VSECGNREVCLYLFPFKIGVARKFKLTKPHVQRAAGILCFSNIFSDVFTPDYVYDGYSHAHSYIKFGIVNGTVFCKSRRVRDFVFKQWHNYSYQTRLCQRGRY